VLRLLKVSGLGWSWKTPIWGGIYAWGGSPTVLVFAKGFVYKGDLTFKISYEEMIDLGVLDLRSLMMANKAPNQLVELVVVTANERCVMHMPLYLYAALSSMLMRLFNSNNA